MKTSNKMNMKIEELLKAHYIQYEKVASPLTICGLTITESVKDYLSNTGKVIKLNQTKSGTYLTTLFNIHDILNEQNDVCLKNNLLIIGEAVNGDYLVINLITNHVGYVFTDDLSEENYGELADIVRELPYGIETFINEAVTNENYISDGFLAEEFIGNPFNQP